MSGYLNSIGTLASNRKVLGHATEAVYAAHRASCHGTKAQLNRTFQ